jgi:hypothetical protein
MIANSIVSGEPLTIQRSRVSNRRAVPVEEVPDHTFDPETILEVDRAFNQILQSHKDWNRSATLSFSLPFPANWGPGALPPTEAERALDLYYRSLYH